MAHRVLPGERAGDAAEAGSGPAERRGERRHELRRDECHADEADDDAEADREEPLDAGRAGREAAEEQQSERKRERDEGRRQSEACEAGRREHALANGRDRLDARCAESRKQAGEHRHDGADDQRDDHGASRKDGVAVRQVDAERARTAASRPFAMPSPMKRPRPRRGCRSRRPRRSPSVITCRRVAPRVRSVPNSRARWAIVIESVLAITKIPTKSAMPPNASRNFCRKLVNVARVLRLLRGLLRAASHLRRGRQDRPDLGDELRGRDALLGGDVDRVELADLAEELLRGRQIEDRHRRAADRRDVAELHDRR